MNTNRNRWRSALGAALVIGLLGGCDIVDPIDVNPNQIPDATMDQLLTGIEVNSYSFTEGQISRLASMWTQQMAGTDRQFVTLDAFTFTQEEGDDYYNTMYTGGGLVDIRNGLALAEEAGTARSQTIAGIMKIHEAYFMGMGASIWGDLIYSEAVNPSEFPQPQLDEQLAVYDAVIALLDEAISDLNTAGDATLGADLTFGGDADAWIRAANSLKARYYLHIGELGNAITAADNGISDPSENWMTQHSESGSEDNHWWEFTVQQRSGYISAGKYMVDLLQNAADPRLQIYYSTDPSDGYSGSPPAISGAGTWSELADEFGSKASEHPVISCAETQFIAAEAAFRTSGAAAAQPYLDAGIACQETRYGITIPTYDAGNMLNEIMTQKYLANFLSIETWMDYRRTCLPDVRSTETAGGGRASSGSQYPARLYYADDEKDNNVSIPEPNSAGNTLRKADMANLSGFWSSENACLP